MISRSIQSPHGSLTKPHIMLTICVVCWEMPGRCVGGYSLWLLQCWTQWENVNGVPLSCKAGSKASNKAVCCMLSFSPTQMACGCWRSCEPLTCPVKLTFVAVGYLDTLRSLQISAFFRRRWNDFQLRFFWFFLEPWRSIIESCASLSILNFQVLCLPKVLANEHGTYASFHCAFM